MMKFCSSTFLASAAVLGEKINPNVYDDSIYNTYNKNGNGAAAGGYKDYGNSNYNGNPPAGSYNQYGTNNQAESYINSQQQGGYNNGNNNYMNQNNVGAPAYNNGQQQMNNGYNGNSYMNSNSMYSNPPQANNNAAYNNNKYSNDFASGAVTPQQWNSMTGDQKRATAEIGGKSLAQSLGKDWSKMTNEERRQMQETVYKAYQSQYSAPVMPAASKDHSQGHAGNYKHEIDSELDQQEKRFAENRNEYFDQYNTDHLMDELLTQKQAEQKFSSDHSKHHAMKDGNMFGHKVTAEDHEMLDKLKDEEEQFNTMQDEFSLIPPFSLNTATGDNPEFIKHWYMAGATVPTEKYVVLNPAVSNRYGVAFTNKASQSRKFEVACDIDILGSLQQGQGFGIWYVTDEYAKMHRENVKTLYKPPKKQHEWDASEEKNGMARTGAQDLKWDLFGMKQHFDGFGVVFRRREDGSNKIGIWCIENDGSFDINSSLRQYQEPHHTFELPFDMKKHEITIRLMMTEKNVYVTFWEQSLGKKTKELAVMSGVNFDGYLGFTSYSGAQTQTSNAAAVQLHGVFYRDLDIMMREGEARNAVQRVAQEAQVRNMDDAFMQGKTLSDMNKALKAYLDVNSEKSLELLDSMSKLTHSVKKLEVGAANLSAGMKTVMGKNKTEALQSMKSRLKGVTDLIRGNAQETDHLMSKVSDLTREDNQPRPDFTQIDADHIQVVFQKSSSMFWLYCFVVFCMLLVLVALLWKMQQFEKKNQMHIL